MGGGRSGGEARGRKERLAGQDCSWDNGVKEDSKGVRGAAQDEPETLGALPPLQSALGPPART